MLVVSNTSPISYLVVIEQIELLPRLIGEADGDFVDGLGENDTVDGGSGAIALKEGRVTIPCWAVPEMILF